MNLEEIRDRNWATTALAGELDKLANLPEGENINKPDSTFFQCLIKIAAVIKGSGAIHVTAAQALNDVKRACRKHAWMKEKEIERQWKNAFKLANPRFRCDQ